MSKKGKPETLPPFSAGAIKEEAEKRNPFLKLAEPKFVKGKAEPDHFGYRVEVLENPRFTSVTSFRGKPLEKPKEKIMINIEVLETNDPDTKKGVYMISTSHTAFVDRARNLKQGDIVDMMNLGKPPTKSWFNYAVNVLRSAGQGFELNRFNINTLVTPTDPSKNYEADFEE